MSQYCPKRALLILAAIASCGIGGEAAAAKPAHSEQEKALVRKMYSTMELMRHELGNHEAELQTCRQKLINMEDALEEMRRQIDDSQDRTQQKIRGTSSAFDTKITSQESALKGLATDLQKLQTHANLSSSTMEAYEKQISDLESVIEMQNKNLDDLKSAMKLMMGALGDNEGNFEGCCMYQVKPGDSLGLIAQRYNATIRDIKELNGLKNDIIMIGQKLRIPAR